MLSRGVRIAVGMYYASAGMRTHAFSLCQGKRCTAVCSIASEQSRHHRKQHTHVNMPPARAQEHKWRKAHTYQNTTHGAASCIIPGIWYPLSITSNNYLLFCCWYPMWLRNICWLPTSHSPLVTARTHVHSAQICMVSGHWAQSTNISDNTQEYKIISDNVR